MNKLKRPEKILTPINGAPLTTSSPSLSAKRPPSAQFPPPLATNNINNMNGMNASLSRTANRPRRDAPTQLLGRGQRTTSAGLRSASIIPDIAALQVSEPRPYVESDRDILKKYRGCPASLVIHLHPTHFRFDQQDSTFKYQSPMKVFIEHLRMGTVPQDLLEYFSKWGIIFYEGCLIVEIHDHKSIANSQNTPQGTKTAQKTEQNPLHKRSEHLTASPWAPFSKPDVLAFSKVAGGDLDVKPKTALEKDKENMPAPNQLVDSQRNKLGHNTKKPKICTVVLHPTPLAMHVDLAIKASTPVPVPAGARRESRVDIRAATPLSASGPRPQTPMLAIPPTPHLGMEPPAKRVRREKMELDGKTVYAAEAHIALVTTAPLFLNPVESLDESTRLLEVLTHPEHSAKVPSPKTRKKTVAEMAAEESAAADEEQYVLILDEQSSSNIGVPGAANPVDGDGQAGSASWEPRFERFKTIENIKIQAIENKKKEKIQQAETMKRQNQEAEAREKARLEAAKRQAEDETNRQRMQLQQQQQQQLQARQQQQQDSHRRQVAQSQASLQGQQAQTPHTGGIQHAHPPQGVMPNGMSTGQSRLMQGGGQFSQPPASSPVVRSAALSSPMVPNNISAQMQRSNSNMGGSPPRPGSAVQQGQQMNPIMAQAMRAQGSQNSHGGTPRMPHATPNMPQAGPRQINQTPRMSQPSPMPGHMIQNSQLTNPPMTMQNNPMANIQLQQAQLAHQQQLRLRQAAAAQAIGSAPVNGQQMTPAQQQYAMQLHQQQQMQNNQAMMSGGQVSAQYAAQMRQMAQAQAQAAAQQNAGNSNYMQNPMHPGMVQQQQAHSQQQMNMRQQILVLMQKFYQQGLPQLQAQYLGQVPPEALAQYKGSCHARASQVLSQQLRSSQLRHQQAAGMAQGMGMNGMGMQRPPGI